MIRRARKEEKAFMEETLEQLPLKDLEDIEKIIIEDIVTNIMGREVSGRWDIDKKGKSRISLSRKFLWGLKGKKIIAHEIGHHIFETKLTERQKKEWMKYSKNYTGELIEDYLYEIANPTEKMKDHFSECYAHYFFDRMTFRKKEPLAFRFLERIYENQSV